MTEDADVTAKVAYLYLDVDDEITSAVARIRAATEAKIALVLPYGSRLATSRINFRLLAREADAQGRGLEIVAPDAAARALAAAAGLIVHPSIAALEAAAAGSPLPDAGAVAPEDAPTVLFPSLEPAPESEKRSVRRSRKARDGGFAPPLSAQPIPRLGPTVPAIPPRTLAIGLAVLLVAILVGGVAAFTFLPTATIAITPDSQVVGPLELTITADPNVTEPDVDALVVPAQTFTYDLAATQTFQATGVRIDEATASGAVTFQNCDTGGKVRIPSGSLVRTNDNVVFSTTDTITVERASIFPFACRTKDTGVVALAPGPGGNVAANRITTIPEGYDPVVLSVTNQNPTGGGKHDEFSLIKQEDVDAALLALQTALLADFDAKLTDTSRVPEGTELFPPTKTVGEATPTLDPATLVGKEQAEFELGLTAQGTVLGVDSSPIDDIADTLIRAEVTSGFTLLEPSIEVEPGTPIVDLATVRYLVTVRALESRDVDVDALLAAIKGKPLHEARLVLDEVGESTIQVWPDWVTTIPTVDGRVTISVGGEAGPTSTGSPPP